MTDETGKKLDAAYSALPREEPRAAVDAAILAASRRALAKPSASRRWAAPVSIAAVLVLAFGVSLHMQEEKPGIESPDRFSAPPASPAPASAPPAATEPAPAFVPELPAQKRARVETQTQPKAKLQSKGMPERKPDAVSSPREEMRSSGLRDEALPAAPAAEPERKDLKEMDMNRAAAAPAAGASAATPPPAALAARAAPAPQVVGRLKKEAAADAMAPIEEPTRELEAIAKLRAENRHEDADKALAEFRRKRPDYRIPEAMWERVRPK